MFASVPAMTAAILGVFTAGTACAHHSAAMFDFEKQIVLQGTLKQLQWTNPHCYVQITVPDADGKPVEWSIEGDSPNLMVRGDPKGAAQLKQLKSGDKVTVVAFPMRNGAAGGSLASVAMADGRVVYGEGSGPPTPAPDTK